MIKRALKLVKKLTRLINKIRPNTIHYAFSFILFFCLVHFVFPIDRINAIFDNFYKVALGIAALTTSYFGSSFFTEELRRSQSIKKWTKTFPPESYQKTYRIIESDKHPGAIYLEDIIANKKHHIWNMLTVYDLGWQQYPREQIKDSKFIKIPNGEAIRTRGELGQ